MIPHDATLPLHFKLEFVSADDTNIITWNTSLTSKSIYHVSQQKTLQTLTENNDMSEDGSQILAYTAVFHFTDYFNLDIDFFFVRPPVLP